VREHLERQQPTPQPQVTRAPEPQVREQREQYQPREQRQPREQQQQQQPEQHQERPAAPHVESHRPAEAKPQPDRNNNGRSDRYDADRR
jgi:hypothetical protein